MTKPLIKYTGGKYNEYKHICQYFPKTINDYYEPFFGGGGVFFRLNGENRIKGKSHINDYSESLIDFYRSVALDELSDDLKRLSESWDIIKGFADDFADKYADRFKTLMLYDKDTVFVTDEMKDYVNNISIGLNLHGFSLSDKIIASLTDKMAKFRKKDISENETDVPYKCITTSICQAFYFIIRDMYNDWSNHNHKDLYTITERSAHFLFIREFCFGSMFRFGSNGDFNVPYGGFSYNSKDFTTKIKNIISEDTKCLFRNTDIQCCDFENVINSWNYKEDDFIFLDPPYDSTFTDYDNNIFNKEDHKRLANCLNNCKCKWLMAIGKTDFIYDLYKDFNIIEYDKTYMYQARGEYENKHTTHIVITNYPIEEIRQNTLL